MLGLEAGGTQLAGRRTLVPELGVLAVQGEPLGPEAQGSDGQDPGIQEPRKLLQPVEAEPGTDGEN